MPNHAQLEEAKRIVAEAAETYSRDKRPILEVLAEFRESITMLRGKGATLSVVAEVLRKANIVVSLATLGRFCKTLPGIRPSKIRKRSRATKPSRRSTGGPKVISPPSAQSPPPPPHQKSSSEPDGGPRIPNFATL
jgi:hypothetical protein